MKKLLSIVLLVVLVISLATTVRATTADADKLYDYISQKFTIAGKEVYLLSPAYLQIAKNYLSAHAEDIDFDTQSFVEGNIKEVIKVMDEAGVTNVFDLNEFDLNYVKTNVKGAAEALGLNVDYDPTTGKIVVKSGDEILVSTSAKAIADIESNVAVPLASPDLVQTDVVNYSYLVVPAVAMIAVAMFVAYKKLEANV